MKKQEIKQVKIESLIPYARNARTHDDAQVAQIAASIKEFGFTNPVLIDGENGIIAGHGRVMAARKLGLDEVPCIELSHLSETQKRAYIITDNKIALNSDWDNELLALELTELDELDFDLDLTGFDEDEIAALIPEEIQPGLTDEDAVPEIHDEPISKLGDVWLLGNHRVMCGDSTSIDAVEKLMNGAKADMVFTDPPYGINLKPQRGTHDNILNDALDGEEFDDFLDSVFSCAISSMKPDTYAFIWTGWQKLGAFERSISKYFNIQAFHVWVKNAFGIGYYSRPKHESFYLCLNGKPAYPSVAPADVWNEKKVHNAIHSCEKPVNLIIEILDTYHKNGFVLDLFGGSGSTLIACEKTNRNCRMMELDQKYCDVIVRRWHEFTGKQATLENDGRTFEEIEKANQCH